jgi:hypothetical protein
LRKTPIFSPKIVTITSTPILESIPTFESIFLSIERQFCGRWDLWLDLQTSLRQGDQVGRNFAFGRLFTLDTFLKISKIGQNFRATFFHEMSCVLILTKKNGLGNILGESFKNSSGHPALRESRNEQNI